MFRKITSKRYPRQDIRAPLYSEFKVYIDTLVNHFKQLMTRYPKALLLLMSLLILASILVFAVRPKRQIAINAIVPVMPINAVGITQFLKIATHLKTVWILSSQLDRLMVKQQPDIRDSNVLQQSFQAIEQLRVNAATKSNDTLPPTRKQ